MIKRIWHGWTTPANADEYEKLLRNEVIPGILAKNVPGFLYVELFRTDGPEEVEFLTLMTFESVDAVRAFVGDDYTVAYVPEAARAVLSRWDERVMHYEVRDLSPDRG
jgi:hypothetical protein